MKKILNFAPHLILSVVLLASCKGFRKIQKSDDWHAKYEAGLKYYQNKDYYRSAVLFEDISPIVRGLPEGEKVEFYLAYCQYYEKSFLLASNQFRVFYETYGRSTFAEEAYFMYAYSLYVSSPDSNLDQKYTIEAMEALQQYLNSYPDNKFEEKASNAINSCQQKLEQKGFDNAKQYFNIRRYKASILAFENFNLQFPDSKYIEEANYLKIFAQYQIAINSFKSLQLERFQLVLNYYIDFVDRYPDSIFIKEAENMYTSSLSNIKNLEPNNTNL